MPAIVSYTSHDYDPIEAVPVIASFDAAGHIAPLYVGIDHKRFKISTYWEKETFHNSIKFNCQIEDGDYLKPLNLTYYIEEKVWVIPARKINSLK